MKQTSTKFKLITTKFIFDMCEIIIKQLKLITIPPLILKRKEEISETHEISDLCYLKLVVVITKED